MVKMPFEKKKPVDPVDLDKLIEKGAPTKGEVEEDPRKWTNINLRIPIEILNQIDKLVEKEIGSKRYRTAWIIQLIERELRKIASKNDR